MLRIAEHVVVYSVVGATMWWQLHVHAEEPIGSPVVALATGLLALLLAREIVSARREARERRNAEGGRAAVIEAERLRQSAYDLCAGLRLGFDICEDCWAWHPDKASKELDRLRAAVGQFVRTELATPASN